MGQATTLGSLLVELGLDSAQFERAVTRATSKTAEIAKTFNVTSKDVYAASQRMGVSVSQFGSQMQALQSRINPGIQALANYRREADLLKEAYRLGVISQEQFRASLRSTIQTYRQAGTAVRGQSGAMQAGMQQLGFQINDIATQFASGTRPMQIFAQQASQVIQSISLMTNSASKFGRFMSGPWGVALTAAVVVLSSLIPKLLETDKAMKDVELASNGLSDAQSVMGEIFDLTTGKIKNQNDMLRLNAKIMAYNLQMQAASEKANFQRTIGTFGRGSLGLSVGQKALGALGVPVGGSMGRESAVRDIVAGLQSGKLSKEAAFDRAKGLDFSGLGVTREEFLGAIRDGISFGGKEAISNSILKSLNSGELDPSLRQSPNDKRTRKPKEDKADENNAAYQAELRQMQVERLRNEADYTANLKSRYQADIAAIDADLATYEQNVMLDKDRTGPQREKLIAERRSLAEQQKQLAEQEYSRELAQQAADLEKGSLQIQLQDAQLRAELADNSKDRRDAELAILELQDRLKLAELDRILAVEATASAAWQNAKAERDALLASQAARKKAVEQGTMGPGEQYASEINKSAGALNDAIAGIKVDGLRSLEDGLVNAIVQFKSLGDVAKNVVSQVLAELLRLQIQQAIIKPLAGALGIPGFADGTNFAPGGLAIVGERGPELVDLPRGSRVIPNHELAGMGGGQQVHKPTFVFPGVTDAKSAREAAGQAARRYRAELNGPTRGY